MKIYHLISEHHLDQCLTSNGITSPSLENEGFCHCCFGEQILMIANQFFQKEVLHVFEIETEKLNSKMLVENSFPHVFGLINSESIERRFKLEKNSNDEFQLPEGLLV